LDAGWRVAVWLDEPDQRDLARGLGATTGDGVEQEAPRRSVQSPMVTVGAAPADVVPLMVPTADVLTAPAVNWVILCWLSPSCP
jgi:hypothetical protein